MKINQHMDSIEKEVKNLADSNEAEDNRRQGLDAVHINALKLRYEGLNFNEISKRLGVAYITTRTWFKTGGKLHNAYLRYSNRQLEKVRTGAIDELRRSNLKAAKTLVNLLDSKSPFMKFRASVEILNRTGTERLTQPGTQNIESKTIIIQRGSFDKRKSPRKIPEQKLVVGGGRNNDDSDVVYTKLPRLNDTRIKHGK